MSTSDAVRRKHRMPSPTLHLEVVVAMAEVSSWWAQAQAMRHATQCTDPENRCLCHMNCPRMENRPSNHPYLWPQPLRQQMPRKIGLDSHEARGQTNHSLALRHCHSDRQPPTSHWRRSQTSLG